MGEGAPWAREPHGRGHPMGEGCAFWMVAPFGWAEFPPETSRAVVWPATNDESLLGSPDSPHRRLIKAPADTWVGFD